MMYSEFVEGTGCRQNEHNFKVFQNLEQMYMNTDMTKEEVYEYGKKLVDNSDTPEQAQFKAQVREDIKRFERDIDVESRYVEDYRALMDAETDPGMKKHWKSNMVYHRDNVKMFRGKVRELKMVLA